MKVSDFDYELPEELIAQYPADRRDCSRMMVVWREGGRCECRQFADILRYLHAGDCLVLNDTRVIPARLYGRKAESGGRVEAFLLEPCAEGFWRCLLRPGRRLRPGTRVAIAGADPEQHFVVQARREDGTFEIAFETADVYALLERVGTVPLPPYIQREAEAADRDRYQTVYAQRPGAVAAPTAGLHFTREILQALGRQGVRTARLTLHVGAGTFKPVKAERVEDHVMHEEVYELSPHAAAVINDTRRQGGRIIAVGTTCVRTLEACADSGRRTVAPGCGRTRIFLHPPRSPLICDGLLTNFHLPRSTLLMLVSCFSSVANVLAAYRLAIARRFRFYSYGDCMLMLPGDGRS